MSSKEVFSFTDSIFYPSYYTIWHAANNFFPNVIQAIKKKKKSNQYLRLKEIIELKTLFCDNYQ